MLSSPLHLQHLLPSPYYRPLEFPELRSVVVGHQQRFNSWIDSTRGSTQLVNDSIRASFFVHMISCVHASSALRALRAILDTTRSEAGPSKRFNIATHTYKGASVGLSSTVINRLTGRKSCIIAMCSSNSAQYWASNKGSLSAARKCWTLSTNLSICSILMKKFQLPARADSMTHIQLLLICLDTLFHVIVNNLTNYSLFHNNVSAGCRGIRRIFMEKTCRPMSRRAEYDIKRTVIICALVLWPGMLFPKNCGIKAAANGIFRILKILQIWFQIRLQILQILSWHINWSVTENNGRKSKKDQFESWFTFRDVRFGSKTLYKSSKI